MPIGDVIIRNIERIPDAYQKENYIVIHFTIVNARETCVYNPVDAQNEQNVYQ